MSEHINYDYITDYLRVLLPPRDAFLAQIEREAATEEKYVPIAEPETAQLLRLLAALFSGEPVLEIGTGCAYSSILLARSASKVTTIERYAKAAAIARENIAKAGMEEKIELLEGEAAEILPRLEGPYALIFLDAAKGQYPSFLPHLLRLLRTGGLLVSDNVLYKGMTASRELLVRRKITIVKRLRIYLKELYQNPALLTSVLPLGDGVAISLKKERNNLP